MDDASIQLIVDEIATLLIGRAPGKIFQFDSFSLAIDFGLRGEGYLFFSVDPTHPRLYLIKRRVRDLEKLSRPLTQFPLTLRKELSGATLTSLTKDDEDRIVRLSFAGADEVGNPRVRTLIGQLTGRSANLFLLDADGRVMQTLRTSDVFAEHLAARYQAPNSAAGSATKKPTPLLNEIRSGKFASPSAATDAYYSSMFTQRDLHARLAAARADLRRRIAQKQNLLKQLELDLQSHTGAESEKRIGDLLLANISTAKRKGNHVVLIDYFSDDGSSIEIEIDESRSLQEEAAQRFAGYQRSKRALGQITARIAEVKSALAKLAGEQHRLESEPPAVADKLSTSSGINPSEASSAKTRREASKRVPGTRSYLSSDGFEILVGRAAKDNDNLTFKVAKPNDTWLHAADYGGSHVVVRNSTRKELPHRTLIEAAQLAAYFSQAKKDPKVDVHYTERKFVSKPKGAKPGLVRMQRSKNITVAPKEAGTRKQG